MNKQIKPFSKPYGLLQSIDRHVHAQSIKGKTVLDIGCGSGWIEDMLLKKKAKKIVGIDVSKEVIEKAKKRKLRKVVYKQASAIELPFKDKTFDVAVSFEVLEHIPPKTEVKMFKEAYRVLQRGGIFYLTTPHKNIIAMLADPAWWLIKHRHYSQEDIIKFAKAAKFKVERIYVKGGISTVLLLLSMYFSKWITHRSPIAFNYLLKNSRKEFKERDGFMTLFLKCIKD